MRNIILALALASTAVAAGEDNKDLIGLDVIVAGHSEHINAPSGWSPNENQRPFGFEYTLSDDNKWRDGIMAAKATDSYGNFSFYAGYFDVKNLYTSGDFKFEAGYAALLIKHTKTDGKIFPVLLPLAEAHYKRLGVSLTVIPPMTDDNMWVVYTSLSVRF